MICYLQRRRKPNGTWRDRRLPRRPSSFELPCSSRRSVVARCCAVLCCAVPSCTRKEWICKAKASSMLLNSSHCCFCCYFVVPSKKVNLKFKSILLRLLLPPRPPPPPPLLQLCRSPRIPCPLVLTDLQEQRIADFVRRCAVTINAHVASTAALSRTAMRNLILESQCNCSLGAVSQSAYIH